MTRCPPCESLRVERRTETPGQLRQIIQEIQSELANGVHAEIGVASSAAAKPDRPPFSTIGDTDWPDYMEYRFRCTRCGTIFLLTAEMYHGQGGRFPLLNGRASAVPCVH